MKRSVADMLRDYISRVMRDKELSSHEVARIATAAGHPIDQSYVNKIKNGSAQTVPSTEKLRALAKGLSVPEDDLFNIVRGIELTRERISHHRLKAIDFAYEGMPKAKKKKADYVIELLDREIERILSEPNDD